MHRYSRAYKDGNSPLTPLTPLPSNTFDFNINAGTSGYRLGGSGNDRRLAIPCSRQGAGSSSSRTRTCTPQSCDSALKKRTVYAQTIATIADLKRVATPIPPTRVKRATKHQPVGAKAVGTMPLIKLQPPPRLKRRGTIEGQRAVVGREADCFESEQENLMPPHRQFDRSRIRLTSPVAPKPLSPRFGAFLGRWGINCLKSIFERQEIDLQTFCCLTADDLELLGIQEPENRERVMAAINSICNIGMNWAIE